MSITSVKSGATGISLALDNNFMEPIATTLVGSGGVNQVTFNDIPQTYKHLQIRAMARWTGTSINYSQPYVRFNSDAGANYTTHQLYGTGSSTGAGGTANTNETYATWIPDSAYSNTFGVMVVDILDYANTNKFKTIRCLGGYSRNFNASANELVGLVSGLWRSTDSVVQINLAGAGNFDQYSRFSLYGIKG